MSNLAALIFILFTLSGIALLSITIVYICNLIMNDYHQYKANTRELA